MRKEWLWVGIIGLFLNACTTETQQQQEPPQPAYNGPVVEIGGAEPRYEPYNPGTNQDYTVNGKSYSVVKNPQNFSQTGLAAWYGEEANGNTTAIGEVFDPNALTAAHPTLPIPSYVRVTNLSNGRQLVVRVNDRGPYTSGRIIDLSRAAAERLNLSNSTKVKVDFINVAPDGSMSGPGTIGTTVAKQSYALPSRPELGASSMGTPMQSTQPDTGAADVRPIDNQTLSSGNGAADNVASSSSSGSSGGFLQAPTAVPRGILESNAPVAAVSAPVVASAAVSVPAASAATGGAYVVQVGALSDAQRAQTWQESLSQRFSVPGKVNASGNVYRVQLGPFSTREQAAALQQRLAAEAQQQSFITAAQGAM